MLPSINPGSAAAHALHRRIKTFLETDSPANAGRDSPNPALQVKLSLFAQAGAAATNWSIVFLELEPSMAGASTRGVAPGAAALVVLLLAGNIGVSRGQLQVGFYSDSCPDAEDTVTAAVQDAAASDPTILPALLRLQFHDCFVRGCDASILIKRPASRDAEENNSKNQGLRGQDVVDAAKAQLEDQCPGVVSCADIIALAARDAVAMTGGPTFDVPTGRRDGLASNLRDADVLPDAADSISVLRSRFAASGLDDRDLVLLTAAHTVGTTACFFVKDRLYNFPVAGGGRGADPSIPAAFLAELKARCAPGDFNTRLPLDRGSEADFDDSILRNIRAGLGVIASDAALAASNATRALVDAYLGAAAASFGRDFAAAMVKMGSIGAITGDDDAGEVRDVCSAFNTN
ncbi:hypothetical protein U9M48_035269 [Paspalum notatum var. saurae]|uniref:Peroxidase n=1 Tax=Paspalum notatum var. saurae TaxID=547442 RepID=A0AAQ3X8V0_PASNO